MKIHYLKYFGMLPSSVNLLLYIYIYTYIYIYIYMYDVILKLNVN